MKVESMATHQPGALGIILTRMTSDFDRLKHVSRWHIQHKRLITVWDKLYIDDDFLLVVLVVIVNLNRLVKGEHKILIIDVPEVSAIFCQDNSCEDTCP